MVGKKLMKLCCVCVCDSTVCSAPAQVVCCVFVSEQRVKKQEVIDGRILEF